MPLQMSTFIPLYLRIIFQQWLKVIGLKNLAKFVETLFNTEQWRTLHMEMCISHVLGRK